MHLISPPVELQSFLRRHSTHLSFLASALACRLGNGTMSKARLPSPNTRTDAPACPLLPFHWRTHFLRLASASSIQPSILPLQPCCDPELCPAETFHRMALQKPYNLDIWLVHAMVSSRFWQQYRAIRDPEWLKRGCGNVGAKSVLTGLGAAWTCFWWRTCEKLTFISRHHWVLSIPWFALSSMSRSSRSSSLGFGYANTVPEF